MGVPKMLLEKLNEFLLEKMFKISSEDKVWMTQDLKILDRKCKREYYKNQKSQKWQDLYSRFKLKCKEAKEKYYTNIVQDLKESNISQWYSKVKRMGGVKRGVWRGSKSDHVQVDHVIK